MSTTATPPPFILLLNSFPGVGKLTIARNIRDLLSQATTGPVTGPQIRLLDNHIIIDLVSAIEPKRNADHHRLRKACRDLAFSALQLPLDDLVILMTSCLSETEEGRDQFEEILAIAQARSCPMVVVNLVCELEENGRRVECEERKKSVDGIEKGKLTDRGLLEKFHAEYELLDLGRLDGGAVRLLCGELETTNLSAQAATEMVWALLRKELGF
ncbi:hypothetical protein N431DRAFT_440779 [Stipitochalara longipes BDJ]|nr:hypothetical protein N431DRAFT_440779 [Stipitochalara longipes BDJ]